MQRSTPKQLAYQRYLEWMAMRAIVWVLGIHHKAVSRWLVQAAQSLPASTLPPKAFSFIEIDKICTFVAKKISVLALASSRLHLWQGPLLCLWEQNDQDWRSSPETDQALADDGLWDAHAEGLPEFYPTRQALRGKDLHHTNRITEMPTAALSNKALSLNSLLQQNKNDVESSFETAHP